MEGTWARGHAWGIYGFTMMYRETRVRRYLERAMSAADYWLDEPNLPEDGISYWDFSFVGEERDVSASAVTASALLELQEFAPPSKAAKYRAAAVKMLLLRQAGRERRLPAHAFRRPQARQQRG